jgi:hypothetical protein
MSECRPACLRLPRLPDSGLFFVPTTDGGCQIAGTCVTGIPRPTGAPSGFLRPIQQTGRGTVAGRMGE